MKVIRRLMGFCVLAALSAHGLADTAKPQFTKINWTDLIPPENLEILLNPPAYISEIDDGSVEDQISSQIKSSIAAAEDDRYQQALVSTEVNTEMNDAMVTIPGFIVPVEFDDEQTITQFFLVPYFGACLHMPPPPPNQIILVEYTDGLQLEALYTPFWISGQLSTSITENDMATAAYSMKLFEFEPYTE